MLHSFLKRNHKSLLILTKWKKKWIYPCASLILWSVLLMTIRDQQADANRIRQNSCRSPGSLYSHSFKKYIICNNRILAIYERLSIPTSNGNASLSSLAQVVVKNPLSISITVFDASVFILTTNLWYLDGQHNIQNSQRIKLERESTN